MREHNSHFESGSVPEGSRDGQLLELMLGQLDESARTALEAELARDAGLRARRDRLMQLLLPLDAWPAEPVPLGLAERVIGRVRQVDTLPDTIRFPTEAAATGGGRGWYFSLRDIVAVAACLLLAGTVLLPSVARLRGAAQQMACARNLGAIQQGTTLYQAAFGGLPFAGNDGGQSWLPTAGQQQPYQSNSRHVYLLIPTRLVSAECFNCPADSQAAQPDSLFDPKAYDDFPTRRHNSFDALNMAGPLPCPGSCPDLAYLADRNPLFVQGRFDDSRDPDWANSPSHAGRGQNVVFMDGRVEWMRKPVYGQRRDNLWVLDNVRTYTGTESRPDAHDAFLVPGFPKTDPDVKASK